MIAIKLEGRLGNQLFQYAFIYAAAERLGTSFYLDKSVENFILPRYFEIENDFLGIFDRIFSTKGYKNIFSIHLKKAFYKILARMFFGSHKTIVDHPASIVENSFDQVKNNYLYEGYFHSESYFTDYKEQIKKLYRVRSKHEAVFATINAQRNFPKRTAVIHIRRTDYVDQGISLPLSYYKKAIAGIQTDEMSYVFISDEPAFIEQEFAYIPNKYVSAHNEIIDLQFLMHADICILSCSSFSWWGAWLNNNENKQVFAPKYWLGFKDQHEFPPGIANHLNFNWVQP
ncbi:MAG: alpha-1,2-fucosyltransferase [Bacteroidota bacterium]|nr:alpha-1,2-fucosyltransferase [Bacteroidota bacterium]